ncbi:WD repeat-containing protein 38-like isoform X2 [Stylophora pistillata]|uniref:WD repeat-containing protein 38-like isoform X2 n=1 Tax=Stylophora pistillata TaxID=50429 RepID=UPI000C04DB6B|nr:WD repeat-containing protein 38-like isoform X2 [Stylophora pistillata]
MANVRGSFETERRDEKDSLTVVDLDGLEDEDNAGYNENGFVSPAELTKVNFRSLIGHKDEVNTCAFSSDWSRIVTGGDDMLVKLWDTKTGKVLFTLDSHEGHTHSVETCCFSPDSEYLCSGSWDTSAIVWNLKTGVAAYVLDGHRNVVQACAFSINSSTVATGSWDCTIRLWPLGGGKMDVKCLKGHRSNIHAVAFSCDRLLASASWDSTLRLWDSQSGVLLHVLEGHTGWVQACSFSEDGKRLASASDDQTVRVWDVETALCLKELECDTDEIHTCCFTPNGSVFASGPAEAETTICIY